MALTRAHCHHHIAVLVRHMLHGNQFCVAFPIATSIV